MEEIQVVLPLEKKESAEMQVRKEKLLKITSYGISVHPESFKKKQKISDFSTFSDTDFRPIEEIIPAPQLQISTAGRVVLFRSF